MMLLLSRVYVVCRSLNTPGGKRDLKSRANSVSS